MQITLFYETQAVAVVTAGETGIGLAYDRAWLEAPNRFPVSLTMPLGDARFGEDVVLPWLANLLPEGSPLRAMTRSLGTAPDDILGLVARIGGDLAGALSLIPAQPGSDYRPIPDAAGLERIIEELPSRPFLAGQDGVTMSLAGAQDKLPVALRDGQLAIPLNGTASTHILKPDNPRLPGSVQNEALCMVLARRAGLPTAEVTTGLAGKRPYLLVTRYDRQPAGPIVQRRHQEDVCQALGRMPAAKYEFNGTGQRGPSLADMFALVRRTMTARDLTRLLDAMILNIAIGNVDSHAKNYSIYLDPAGQELTPLYDLMSGLCWDGITQNHAQAVGGQRRGAHVYRRHWRRMAAACGLSASGTLRRVGQLTTRLLRELPRARAEVEAMPAGGGAMLGTFADAIARRIAEVQAHAGYDETSPRDTGDDETPGPHATAYR
jgi:serine/threonine-protein kinase HipA